MLNKIKPLTEALACVKTENNTVWSAFVRDTKERFEQHLSELEKPLTDQEKHTELLRVFSTDSEQPIFFFVRTYVCNDCTKIHATTCRAIVLNAQSNAEQVRTDTVFEQAPASSQLKNVTLLLLLDSDGGDLCYVVEDIPLLVAMANPSSGEMFVATPEDAELILLNAVNSHGSSATVH